MDRHNYLGATVSKQGGGGNDIVDRIRKARVSFMKLKQIWPYVVSNRDILAKTKLKKISTEVKLRRWKWVEHILRMDKNSKCETALTWTPEGRRNVGRPKTTWRSTIENETRILE